LRVNFEKTSVVWIGKNKFSSSSIKTRWKLNWNQQSFKMLGIFFHVDLSKMIKLNYTDKIKAVQNCITYWKRRILTPIGKITVIKTLLIPIFIQLFTSLPNPPQDIIININRNFYDFIWEGNVKIKQSILVREYCDGGLKMINLMAFIKALKLSWLRRLTYGGIWSYIISEYVDMQKLFHCGKHYIDKIAKQLLNSFWKDTMEAFANLIEIKSVNVNSNETCNIPLFYNHCILIGNKSVFLKSWFEAGAQYICDVHKSNSTEIMTVDEFNAKFNLNANFLTYTGIINAVKQFLNKCNQNHKHTVHLQRPIFPTFIKYILINQKGCKELYTSFNQNSSELPTSQNKWCDRLHCKIEQHDWKIYYSLPFNITSDTRIQWFQVRLLHRVLGTNELLFNIGRKENSLCTFCLRETESIEHLFWRCLTIQLFYENVLRSLEVFSTINEQIILFGWKEKQFNAENLLLIYVKMYIYKCKMLKIHPSVDGVKAYLKYILNINKEITVQSKKLIPFFNKFEFLIKTITGLGT
jgi:hypothetical protein